MLTIAAVGALLLVVTWLGYPAAIVLLGRGRRPAPLATAGDDALPAVTCVLATRDDVATVADRVLDFLRQDYPAGRLDVVVGVDAGAAELVDVLRGGGGALGDPRVTVVLGDAEGGKGGALNAAVRAARGEMLVFSDSRQRFEPRTTRRLVSALLADPRLGATSGRLLLPVDEQSSVFRHYLRYELAIRSAEARVHSAVGVSGSVYALRRALWAPLPAGLILDDLYLPMRLVLDGWRIGFTDDALAFETRKVAASQEYRRKVRTLTGNFQLCAWLPAVLVPVRNPIWLQFVCHKLLRLLTPWCAFAVAVGVAGAVWRSAGEALPVLLAATLAGALWVAAGRDAVARKLRGAAVQFASLQAAVVTATANSVRGRWDVWTR
jgi:cellulose synthase/poly-beta-1,6-N-acetylglucosamine synthase-like glycosyltransferase